MSKIALDVNLFNYDEVIISKPETICLDETFSHISTSNLSLSETSIGTFFTEVKSGDMRNYNNEHLKLPKEFWKEHWQTDKLRMKLG